ncbi:unnamed protein product [Candida verbasci]|uniref:LsmAD domain-containing protein n=1 Tax=Candida verbasci TaxID=1227364 RepID=A0A9W4TWF0_9ASCO|nr:unnamed protein product [Candida verbasci]
MKGTQQPSSRKQNGHRNNNKQRQDSKNDDKLIHLISKCVGKIVIATTLDGNQYKGLLISNNLQPNLSVILNKPQNLTKDEKLPDNLVIYGKDLVDLEVDLSKKPEFKIDEEITTSTKIKERELTKWIPDEPIDNNLLLEDDGSNWDQFASNEEKFGIKSTFDEHLYTTKIDKNAPDYQQRLERANKIAKEIESQQTTDLHMLEERGLIIDDSGIDEEDKYSGVDRRGNELLAALKNTTIAQDKQVHKNDYNLVDPAIVSSSKENSKKLDYYRLNSQSEINSFKQFSANFKIPHKVPADLLPILSKNVDKQKEIINKNQTQQQPKNNKYNIKAASFTPTFTPLSPQQQQQLQQQQQPTSRTFSNGSSSTSSSKRYHITSQDFFGIDKIPTKEKQQDKIKKFKTGFSFVSSGSQELTFQTPPTWDSTIEESYSKLFPKFAPIPTFSSPTQYKYPMAAAAATQQQAAAIAAAQMQAAQVQAMMYQQQFQPQPYYQQPQFYPNPNTSFIPPPIIPYPNQFNPQHQQQPPKRFSKRNN